MDRFSDALLRYQGSSIILDEGNLSRISILAGTSVLGCKCILGRAVFLSRKDTARPTPDVFVWPVLEKLRVLSRGE